MIPLEVLIAGIMLVALIVYILSGGADFGGGIWDLFTGGPRGRAQRETIAHAIGPIWEANHVWMILVLVLLFVCFPDAFAAITTALHIPLAIMLVGIVLRGSAFVFRSYDEKSDPVQRRWTRVFAGASVVAPFMLGVTVGAIASGRIEFDPRSRQVVTDFVSSWLAPFPFAVGLFTLTLCAFLAAVYLTVEAPTLELKEDFRRRALIAAVAVGVSALLSFWAALEGAPRVREVLTGVDWSLPFQLATGAIAVGAIAALWRRSYQLARALAMGQAIFILLGWGAAQYPYLLAPNLHIADAAAPRPVLRMVLTVLGVGTLLLLPAFGYLYTVFKGARHEHSA